MDRIRIPVLAGLLVLLLPSLAVLADDDPQEDLESARQSELHSVAREIRRLQRRADALEDQRDATLAEEVERYLRQGARSGGAAGGGLAGVTLTARFTAVALTTLNGDPGDRHAVNGDVDLDFDFEVTDNLDLFIHLTANTTGRFPSEFGPTGGIGGATLSGMFDGIGVDGTVPTSPGSARVYEAGVLWYAPAGDRTLHLRFGKLDPRRYFAQNTFADDENTQFLNNLFDDPPAISWPTTAAGQTILGLLAWMNLGGRDQVTVTVGWFNTPGQFFNVGLLLFQAAWTGQVRGREMNLRLYGQLDDRGRQISAGAGLSWDWWVTDRIGVFFRATGRDNYDNPLRETNFVESDYTAGVVLQGPIRSRPDDTLGLGVGYMKGPIANSRPGGFRPEENNELVIEVYYRYLMEDGKLQITPLVQFIVDPGAGTFGDPDLLVIAGVRIFVPF